jgi:GNAT superfamily N-acetyltransferase
LNENKGQICRAVLSSLPEWFGIPEAVDEYVAAAEDLPMLVARTDMDRIVGFLSVKLQTAAEAEAYVLGVRGDWHRQGIGTQLFQAAGALARSQRVPLFDRDDARGFASRSALSRDAVVLRGHRV